MNSTEVLSALSTFFYKQDLNLQTYILMSVIIFIGAAFGTSVNSFLKVKSKNFASRTDFEQLKEQLVKTTEATKKIDAHFTERVWINQQIWLKKQECYENIFLHLEKISSYVKNEVSAYEEDKDMNRGPSDYNPYMSEEEEAKFYAEWEAEVKAYKEKMNSPEEKNNREKLQKEKVTSFFKLTELMQVKAVFIDEKVKFEIDKLQKSLSINNDPSEDWDMHFSRMDTDTTNALKAIRDICRVELNL